jgi:tetratricopeptide (TPR) repeat protein
LPEAIEHLSGAAAAAARLGFTAAEAYHLSNLGRVQELSGEPQAAIGTLRSAIEKASAAGDFRAAAVARVRLGRVLRATGDRESARSMVDSAQDWYDGFGGGEGALLAESTLAALAAEDGVDGVDVARQRLSVALDHARRAQDHEAEVLTLDALARSHASAGELDEALALLAAADDVIPAAGHLVFDSDRIDARQARAFIDNAHGLDAASTPA